MIVVDGKTFVALAWQTTDRTYPILSGDLRLVLLDTESVLPS